MTLEKSIRTDPSNHAAEGDERIRTAVPALGADSAYERRSVAAPPLFTKHRGLALGIAADYRVPGMDADDVRQEALLGLWEAARAHDPAVGPFGAFARTVVTRRCVDLLRAQTRGKQMILTRSAREEQLELVPTSDVIHLVLARERLREALASDELIEVERRRRSWRETKRRARARAAA